MMDALNISALILTVSSFIFGLIQLTKVKKLKKVTLCLLQNAAGDLCKIQQSTEWSYNNLRDIQCLAVDLQESNTKKMIIRKASDGQGDAASADRLVITLFSHLMTIQESHFDSKEIIHPEKEELPLWRKELRTHINKN